MRIGKLNHIALNPDVGENVGLDEETAPACHCFMSADTQGCGKFFTFGVFGRLEANRYLGIIIHAIGQTKFNTGDGIVGVTWIAD